MRPSIHDARPVTHSSLVLCGFIRKVAQSRRSHCWIGSTGLAAQPPVRLIKLAGAVVELAAELLDIANPNVISDIAAAADAARAAATTARVNIDINVVAIKDAQARAALAEQTDGLEEKVVLAADSLSRQVRERILR